MGTSHYFSKKQVFFSFSKIASCFSFFCCQLCLHMPRLIARICMGRCYIDSNYIIMLSCGGAIILIVVLVAQMSCDIYGRSSCDIRDVWIRPSPSNSRLISSSSRLVYVRAGKCSRLYIIFFYILNF